MKDCLFCQIINDTISTKKVYEDEYILAFHDINPKAEVHVLVIPKKHLAHLGECNSHDKNDSIMITHLTLSLNKIATLLGLEKGFRTIINTKSGGGQEIYHLHYHILGNPSSGKINPL